MRPDLSERIARALVPPSRDPDRVPPGVVEAVAIRCRAKSLYTAIRYNGTEECLKPLYPISGGLSFGRDDDGLLWIEGGFIDQAAGFGDYILRDDAGNLSALSEQEFEARFETLPAPPAAP